MKFILMALFFSQLALAKDCNYTISKDDIKLTWIAYKTALKSPVKGSFRYLGVEKDYSGKSIKDVLTGIKFNIDTVSVTTKNTARDAQIVKYFFQKMTKGLNITGSITGYKKKTILTRLTMNGVTKDVPLKAIIKDNKILATGSVDVFDFSLHESLKGINKACYDLHEGKTWNDVGLELEMGLEKTNC